MSRGADWFNTRQRKDAIDVAVTTVGAKREAGGLVGGRG